MKKNATNCTFKTIDNWCALANNTLSIYQYLGNTAGYTQDTHYSFSCIRIFLRHKAVNGATENIGNNVFATDTNIMATETCWVVSGQSDWLTVGLLHWHFNSPYWHTVANCKKFKLEYLMTALLSNSHLLAGAPRLGNTTWFVY